MLKSVALHTRILTGVVAGILAGILVRQMNFSEETLASIISFVKPVGDIFLRMIFMMVIPLIFSALTLGVAELGDISKLGRIGFKIFKFSLVVTTLSVAIGVGAVMVLEPGKDLSLADRTYLTERFKDNTAAVQQAAESTKQRSFGESITQIVPKNPVEDMARAFDPTYTGGGLLAVMFFALILGIALTVSDQEKVRTFKSFLEGMYEIVMKVIGFGMKLAPFGVAALLFVLTVNLGVSILAVLLKYVLIVLGALAFHQFVTYSIILRFFAGTNPLRFFGSIKEVMLTAFSTSSSNATLPTAIRTAIEKLHIPKDITHFVLTIGSTGNQHGTALYEGITILFLAQCFGVDLSVYQQIMVVFISVLAGMGTAGVPGGSLPVIMLILISIGVPGESIALIYGVDRILDMSRTVLNVTGDLTAASYIHYQEQKRAERMVQSGK